MSVVRHLVKRGAYYDSVVLMQLQRGLAEIEGVEEAGAVMATPANLELLADSGLASEAMVEARPDDLLVAVRGVTESVALAALGRFEQLVSARQTAAPTDYRPKSLAAAFGQQPLGEWVLVSVPGKYAAGVARQALEAGRNVFLYSDNVSLDDEVALKRQARAAGLMVLGPDCGTAIVGGIGFGFANSVRSGPIGLVGASGTGLQSISSRVHALGSGVSHAVGTGGRDLARDVGGISAQQGLELLAADEATEVLVLVSKPPHPEVATRLLATAAAAGKPVVVHFQGAALAGRRLGNIRFAADLEDAAALAVGLVDQDLQAEGAGDRGALRGLFSGGTLASEMLLRLETIVPEIGSNLEGHRSKRLIDLEDMAGHAILDLGADQFTLGRPHPMIDPQIVAEHLAHTAADPEVGTVLIDMVLGHGAHHDPAAIFAPAIRAALADAKGELEIVAVVVGTDEDPQELERQKGELEAAGAEVCSSLDELLDAALARVAVGAPRSGEAAPMALRRPTEAINLGLELFRDSLVSQGLDVVQVDWRPPAGGDEKLARILERLRGPGRSAETSETT